MDPKQVIAIIIPIALIVMMYLILHVIAGKYGNKVGWFSGLVIYWIIWGAIYPLVLLGDETVFDLIRPQSIKLETLLLMAVPVIFAAISRFFMGTQYEKTSVWVSIGLLVTALGNGVFEEILWRGTYLALFQGSILFQMIWPSIMFGLWHYAPGSVSNGGRVLRLMVGAVFLAFFLVS